MGRHIATSRRARQQRGFNIVEILAALLVMAVAIVGIAALYSDQTHTPPDARMPLLAAELAERMDDRIRATPEGREGFATTVGVICLSKKKTPLPQDKASLEAACWEDEVERALPSGLGSISRDTSLTPASYVVAVSWSAPGAGAASYVTRVEIREPLTPAPLPKGEGRENAASSSSSPPPKGAGTENAANSSPSPLPLGEAARSAGEGSAR